MDDTEDDARYPPNHHHRRRHHHHKHHHHRLPPGPHPRRYPRGGEEEEEEEDVVEDGGVEGSEEEAERNGMEQSVEDAGAEGEEEEEDEGEEDEDEEGAGGGAGYRRVRMEEPFKRRRKRRRLDRLALGFEFAPRMAAAAPASVAPAARPPPRSSPADWSEDSTFVLLDAWGDLFIQNGRKSLRSDEWMEVAKKVMQSSRTARSEAQCRNRLDTLKKKYKKEKSRMVGSSNSSSKWVYFAKMESLMSSPPPPAATRQQPRLPCGFDSGEYVFMNSKVYVNRSNDLDEMRDSPGDSECEDDEEDDESDGLPPERAKAKGSSDSSSFRMLANSIQKFGEIYEKIESSKRQHMAELERMRKDFHRDLEIQKRQILERAQAEIAKIRQGAGDDDDDDGEEHEDEDMNNGDEEIDVSLYDGSS
ncbi:hypothetical protein Taro_022063 [Colocasia esculenta]|uniref:Myb/SANT-like DNA-binding domain-containing protein n=1 Tax=Colocasia esculenta TaxID=4460 RepID=A0A843V2W0_COLES|nr:hypothetical protein [Colocasia esculenta]